MSHKKGAPGNDCLGGDRKEKVEVEVEDDCSGEEVEDKNCDIQNFHDHDDEQVVDKNDDHDDLFLCQNQWLSLVAISRSPP